MLAIGAVTGFAGARAVGSRIARGLEARFTISTAGRIDLRLAVQSDRALAGWYDARVRCDDRREAAVVDLPAGIGRRHGIAGHRRCALPVLVPDSRHVAFFSGSELKRVALAGGPVQTLCRAGHGRGGAWNRNNVIIFSPDTQTPL